jgi:hypothetical protein
VRKTLEQTVLMETVLLSKRRYWIKWLDGATAQLEQKNWRKTGSTVTDGKKKEILESMAR